MANTPDWKIPYEPPLFLPDEREYMVTNWSMGFVSRVLASWHHNWFEA